MCDALKQEKFKAGDEIIKQGDPGEKFYIVEEGQCIVMKKVGGDPANTTAIVQFFILHKGHNTAVHSI